MKRLIFLMLLLCGFGLMSSAQNDSFYDGWFKSNNGTDTIRLSTYTGKKLLIVNIASMNSNFQQVGSLQQLYNQYKDSGLVVIAVPSNNFYNEPGSDAEIGQLLENRFNISFLLASKSAISGMEAPGFYQWFANKGLNGVMNGKIRGDFTKILISEQGEIIGVYGETVDPLNTVIVTAIRKR